MKCSECEAWDKELDVCGKPFADMENMVCLLKIVAWQMEFFFGEEEDEEDWKNKKE